MQTKFKDIAQYYLGTGIKIQWDSEYQTTHKTDFTISDYDWLINKQKGKPLLRSLDSLTKPITVKGYNDDKEFYPAEEIFVGAWGKHAEYYIKNGKILDLSFIQIELLLQWNFNVFGLEETEYIKID